MALKIRQSVVLKSQDFLNGEPFQGLIQAITQEHIIVHIPVRDLSVPAGKEFTVSFWDNTATYEFLSRVLQAKEPGVHQLYISRPNQLTKKINRNFDRLEVNSQGAIRYDDDKSKNEPCTVLDLSGGGAQILCQDIFKEQDPVVIDTGVSDHPHFKEIRGRIMWKRFSTEGLARVGVQFEQISVMRRNDIVEFIKKHQS